MFMSRIIAAVCALLLITSPSLSADPDANIGTPATTEELSKFFAIQPGGIGLPPGKGTATVGKEIYMQKCSYCHGEKLEGIHDMAGPALAGGRGTLASKAPRKTVESYWPQASTLFDYIWRAMPFDSPGSLSADEVYSLSAYILTQGKVLKDGATLDAQSMSKVQMPNADGFYVGSGPDVLMYGAELREKKN